jgi:hypothetical protein
MLWGTELSVDPLCPPLIKLMVTESSRQVAIALPPAKRHVRRRMRTCLGNIYMRRCYMHIQLYKHATLHDSTGHAAAAAASQPAARPGHLTRPFNNQARCMRWQCQPFMHHRAGTGARGMMLGLLLRCLHAPLRGARCKEMHTALWDYTCLALAAPMSTLNPP